MKTLLTCVLALCLLTFGCATAHYNTPEQIRNFEQVSTNLYRSGQLTYFSQWQYVADEGIKKVIKLNTEKEYSDNVATNYGIQIVYLPLPPSNFWQIFIQPSEDQYFRVLRVIKDSLNNNEKILVHCTYGEDRTSAVIAGAEMYILHTKTKKEAHKDMKAHNFHWTMFGWDDFYCDLPEPSPEPKQLQ